ncbi:alpha/beta hydrolase [Demequina mangrovi]|uniref:Pimeloyl-ACP methyl ester carboxylesterase n=1 Tax=Demequina mangrovi TaxID=1043493 RepID=A0A1H6Z7P7_9MICO|nr:alpha/beta hydrolase [Demequina mangrovi]SEJ45580.1 Pimeloyl-ACP methyl ester carboxylesterase [Demequina mangrovi]
MQTPSLTPLEREQVDAANAADGPAVVLLHDLWTLAGSWDPWRTMLAERGFPSVAVPWPHEPASVAEALADPDAAAGVSLRDMRAAATRVVDALDRPPMVIGHCFGALVAQQLAGTGRVRATVAITPAPMKGSVQAPELMLVAAAPVLKDPANRERAIRFAYPEYRYAWANTLGVEEARELWETSHVPGSGTAVFEVARARREQRSAASVDTINPDRGPMLVVSAARDRLVPPVISSSTFRIQSRNPSPTDFVEFFDRGHSLTLDSGWPEVADRVIEYLEHQ